MGNAQTVQKIYEAFGTGDIPTILDQLSDDVAWESWADNAAQAAGVPWLEARKGKDGATEFFGVLQPMTFHEFSLLGVLEGGNQVAAELVIDIELPNGARVRDEEVHLWTFDNAGKVTRFRHYVDTAKHIAAAGS